MIENLSHWMLMRSVDDDLDFEDWETPEDLEQAQFKPTIGVALGGGAARGWAHIGVLRALEDGGIRPDIISGTSIGAIVGGCYAADKIEKLEEFALSITNRNMLGLADFKLGGSGLIVGNKLEKKFIDTIGEVKIDDLDRPFTCVAAELGTGHEVWLGTGLLVDAVRASASLPGILNPCNVGGRWLVDGALVNPIPVSVCRALGARVVIAVDLTPEVLAANSTVVHPLPAAANSALTQGNIVDDDPTLSTDSRFATFMGKGESQEDLPGVVGIMMESFNIIMDRIGRARLAGDPPDIKIGPRLGKIGFFDFHRAEESIQLGYDSANRALDEIRDYISLLS